MLPGKISDPMNLPLKILMLMWTFLFNNYSLWNMKGTEHKKLEEKQAYATCSMLYGHFKIKNQDC